MKTFKNFISENKEIPASRLSLKDRREYPFANPYPSDFSCLFLNLTSLEGAPIEINGAFDCSHNKLTSLEGCPTKIKYEFDCSDNKIISLEHAPHIVGSMFNCDNNRITSLIGVDDVVTRIGGLFECYNNPITEGGIGLILIPGISGIGTDIDALAIIDDYLNKPESIYECQKELIEAGYEAYAQL